MTDNQKEREAFEAWFSDQGQYPKAIQRRDDGYLLSTAQSAWVTWQARAAIDAALAARGAVPAGWRELLAQSRENFRRNFGSQGLGIWVYEDIEELLAEAEAAPQQVAQPSEPEQAARLPSIDEIAQFIRYKNGASKCGAGTLAEHLHEWLTKKGGQR